MLDSMIDPDEPDEEVAKIHARERRRMSRRAKELGIDDWEDAYQEYIERYENIHQENNDD